MAEQEDKRLYCGAGGQIKRSKIKRLDSSSGSKSGLRTKS